MPFTFSHPAIILPATYLPKKYYSLSGLMVGSMAPDFEYFIRMRDYSKYSHTLSGMLWFDVPLGLAIIFIFHNVVRNTLIEHLPFVFNVRFSVFEKFNWNEYFKKNIVVVLISLLIGIASHLLWDSFTHDGTYFTEAIPFLQKKIDLLNHHITIAQASQFGWSVIGLIVMLIYMLRFPEEKNTQQSNILSFWLIVSLIAFMVVNIRLYLDYIFNEYQHEDIIVTSISGLMIGIISLSVFLNMSNRRTLYKKLDRIRNK